MRLFMAPMTRLILISSLFWGGPVLAAEPVPAPPQPDPHGVITDSTGGQWRTLPNMTTPRAGHTATLLPDGRVLVVGGGKTDEQQKTAEIFDPAANNGMGAWTPTAPMDVSRAGHTATLLPTGQVLVMGGISDESITGRSSSTTHRPVERFDPAGNGGQGAWITMAPLQVPRQDHISILLPNGKIVVVGAGLYETGRTIELYDPSAENGQGASRIIGDLKTLSPATATLLPTGQVLVMGVPDGIGDCRHRALLVTHAPDEQSLTITQASRTLDLCSPTVTPLPNGTVFITGNTSTKEGIAPKPVFFVYDPTQSPPNAWNRATLPPQISDKYSRARYGERPYSSATGLLNGRILLIGREAVHLYDPAARNSATAWISLDQRFTRFGHTATLLSDGTVLIVGGTRNNANGTMDVADNVQRYTPAPVK